MGVNEAAGDADNPEMDLSGAGSDKNQVSRRHGVGHLTKPGISRTGKLGREALLTHRIAR